MWLEEPIDQSKLLFLHHLMGWIHLDQIRERKKVSESDEDREEDLIEKLNRDLYKRKTINIHRITVNQLIWWTPRILGSELVQVLTAWFTKNRDIEPQGWGIRIFSLAVKDKLVISLIFNFQLFFLKFRSKTNSILNPSSFFESGRLYKNIW